MNLGLDIGRQFVKAVLLDKNRGGTKIVNTGIRLVPDQNKTYDPESITKPMWVMAVRELMREMNINPKRVKNLVSSFLQVDFASTVLCIFFLLFNGKRS